MEDTSLPTVERLWPDPATGPYRLRLTFGEVNGRPAVLGVELWGCEPIAKPWLPPWEGLAPPEPAAVTAAAVRLPLGTLLDAWADLHLRSKRASQLLYGAVLESGNQVMKFEEPHQRGRPRLSQEFLGRVADVYREALANGDRSPAVTVAERLGARTPSTARSWVSRARKAGLLGLVDEEELQRAIKATLPLIEPQFRSKHPEASEEQQETPE